MPLHSGQRCELWKEQASGAKLSSVSVLGGRALVAGAAWLFQAPERSGRAATVITEVNWAALAWRPHCL